MRREGFCPATHPLTKESFFMSARTARLSLALLFATPLVVAPLGAQGVEYSAGTNKYRVTTTTKGTQTTPAGAASFEVSIKEQVTVNVMRHTKDTVMATMVLDSLALTSSSGPLPDASKLIGAKWVSLISPTGKFYTTQAPAGADPQLAQVMDGVAHFLPSFRGNLAAGNAWSDTTTGKVSQQGMEVDRTSIANFKVLGDTVIAGQKAMRIERVTNVKAGGMGNMQGTPVTMETTGRSNGMFFVTPMGVYLGMSSTDDVNVKITIVSQGAEVNIKQLVQNKVEAIK
ncbi:MAG: hypothetical protein ABIY52_19140 [Gemmatimonadaceae bacterium]